MATGIISNTPKVIKKLEEAITGLENKIGIVQGDVIQLAFKEIREKGFLKGVQEVNGKYIKYEDAPGANLRARPRKSRVGQGGHIRPNRLPPQPRPIAFHKSKIMDRVGKLPLLFRSFRWTRSNSTGANRTLYHGNVYGGDVRIKKEGRSIVGEYKPTGNYQNIFSRFEFSKRKIIITNNGEDKRVIVGRKKVVSNGFRRAVKKFQKFMKTGLTSYQQMTTRELARL